jgi:hypothetical protein
MSLALLRFTRKKKKEFVRFTQSRFFLGLHTWPRDDAGRSPVSTQLWRNRTPAGLQEVVDGCYDLGGHSHGSAQSSARATTEVARTRGTGPWNRAGTQAVDAELWRGVEGGTSGGSR